MYINFSCCYCCCLLSLLKNFNILQQRMTNDLTSCEEFKIAKYYKKLEIHLSVTTHFDLKSIFFACLIFAYILFQSIFLEFLINVIYERLMVGVMVVLSINLSLVQRGVQNGSHLPVQPTLSHIDRSFQLLNNSIFCWMTLSKMIKIIPI